LVVYRYIFGLFLFVRGDLMQLYWAHCSPGLGALIVVKWCFVSSLRMDFSGHQVTQVVRLET